LSKTYSSTFKTKMC